MQINQLPPASSLNNSDKFAVDTTDGITKSITASALVALTRTNSYGSPLVADTVTAMTDTSKVYVYTGNETGYTNGDWYYYNGTAWVSGGAYNSVAVNTDTTLRLSGVAADAKAVGDADASLAADIAALDGTLSDQIQDIFLNTATDYDSLSFPVSEGQYCLHANNLFKARQDIPTIEAWNIAHWERVNVGNELYGVGEGIESAVAAEATAREAADDELRSVLSEITQLTDNINTASMGRITISSSGVISPTSSNNSFGSAEPFSCNANTGYVLSVFDTGIDKVHIYIYFYDASENYITDSLITKYNVASSTAFTSPANAAFMAFYLYNSNGVSDAAKVMVETGASPSAIYVPPYTAKDNVAEGAIASVNNRVSLISNTIGSYLVDCFEIGNITISNSGWTYGVGSGPTRVRTKEGTTLRLKAGTVIGLTNYTDTRYYIGMRDDSGAYSYAGWLTADYTITNDCDCVVLITNVPEVSQSSPVPLASLFFGYSFTDFYAQNKYINYDDVIKNINHRGYNKIAPENTLPAFRLSKLMGFNIVETDVAFTSDGVPVCLHDSTINRTARNADGTEISSTINIGDITYQQALTYDFGIWKDSKYAGTKIPTLEQFFILCKNIGLNAYVEIKTDQTLTETQIHGLMDIAKATGMYDRITWICFLPAYLGYVKSYDSNAKMIYVVSSVTAEVITNANNLRLNGNLLAIDAQLSVLDSQGIQRCIDADIPMEVWTADTEDTILDLSPYITGVTSNYTIAGKVLYERTIYLN